MGRRGSTWAADQTNQTNFAGIHANCALFATARDLQHRASVVDGAVVIRPGEGGFAAGERTDGDAAEAEAEADWEWGGDGEVEAPLG